MRLMSYDTRLVLLLLLTIFHNRLRKTVTISFSEVITNNYFFFIQNFSSLTQQSIMVIVKNEVILKELLEDRWPIKRILGHNGEVCAETPLMIEWEDIIWNPKDATINSVINKLINQHKNSLDRVWKMDVNIHVAKWKPSCIFLKDMHGDANHTRMREYCMDNGLMFALVYMFMT